MGSRVGGWVRRAVVGSACVAVLGGWAGRVHAQVAAPSLVPFTFFQDNPATIQWGAPSRVGVQISQAQQVTDPTTITDNSQGYAGGVRGVWDYFSFAAEGAHRESTTKPFGISETSDYGAGALAVGIGRHFSLGVGTEHLEGSNSGFNTATLMQVNTSVVTDVPVAGLSIRLGEWFFLGGAVGREMLRLNDHITPANNLSDDRDVYRYGVGIRTRGAVLFHLEYFIDDRPDFADSTLGHLGHKTDHTGVIEANFSGFLLAFSETHTDQDPALYTSDSKDTGVVAIGYAPYTGLTVVLEGSLIKETFPPNPMAPPPNSQTTTIYAIDVTYLFGN